MAKAVWGIDVSKYSVKAVRMEMGKEEIKLTHAEVLPYSTDLRLTEASLSERIKEVLRDLKYMHKIKRESVCISLPTHSAFNRLIKLPPVDIGKLDQLVQYEAQSQIPFGLDQIIWGYQLVNREYQEGEEKEVILLAIKKDIVESFLQNIEEVELNIDIVQLSPVSTYNFLMFDQDMRNACMVLDIGAENASLIIIDEGRFWIRILPVTANDMTKAIQDAFNVAYDKAENLKIKAASSENVEKIYQTILPVYKNIVSEIHRSLGFYKSIAKQAKFERMLLLGNGTKTINFQRFISQSLQVQAGRVQKLNNISIGDTVDSKVLNSNLQTLGTALGLALQGLQLTDNKVNLLPAVYIRRKIVRKKYPIFIAATLMLYLLLILIYHFKGREMMKLDTTFKEADKKRIEFEDKKGIFEQVKSFAAPVQETEKFLSAVAHERDPVSKKLKQIYDNLPDNGDPNLNDSEKIWILKMNCDLQPPKDVPAGPARLSITKQMRYQLIMEVAITRYKTPRLTLGIKTDSQRSLRTEDEGLTFIRSKLLKNINTTAFTHLYDIDSLGMKETIYHAPSMATTEKEFYMVYKIIMEIPEAEAKK